MSATMSTAMSATRSTAMSATRSTAMSAIILPTGQTIQVVDWDDDREGTNWGVYGMSYPYRFQGYSASDLDYLKNWFTTLPDVNKLGTPKTAIKKFHWSGGIQPNSSTIFISY